MPHQLKKKKKNLNNRNKLFLFIGEFFLEKISDERAIFKHN